MKRKLKIGDSRIITIADNGSVSLPGETRMSVSEIANLFGIYYREAKRHIRAIEKLCMASGDYSRPCTVERKSIYPEYYGLEMIIALAFRIQSKKIQIFREWLCNKAVRKEIPEMPVMPIQNYMLN